MIEFFNNIDPRAIVIVGYAIYVIGTLFISWQKGWIIFVPHKKTTLGKVTFVEWDGPVISYKVDGRSFTIKDQCRKIEGLKEEVKVQLAQRQRLATPIGKEIKIAYDSSNPEKAKVCPNPAEYALIFGYVMIGLFAAIQCFLRL